MVRLAIEVKVAYPWWLIPYLKTLDFMCLAMGTEPDMDKVNALLDKHVKYKIGKK